MGPLYNTEFQLRLQDLLNWQQIKTILKSQK